MHSRKCYDEAMRLRRCGVPFAQIGRQLDLPKGTVAHWFYGSRAQQTAQRRSHEDATGRCPVCSESFNRMPLDRYAYLLGQYLGDGHLVTSARVPVLRVYCTATYPDIIDECSEAMPVTLARSVSLIPKTGCVTVQSYSPAYFRSTVPG